MFWYGPSPLFLLSVMTLNDVEGFRGSASVRSGLFQVGKASAKIMKAQSLLDKKLRRVATFVDGWAG